MADDQNQRPYRGNDAPTRAATPAGSDPLAELARLIGQNDPFSEFGRDGTRRAATPGQPSAHTWPPEPAPSAPPAPQPAAPRYGAQDFTRQSFGSPLAGTADLYHADAQGQGYPAAAPQGAAYETSNYEVAGYGAPGYEAHGFPAETAAAGYEQEPFPKAAGPFAPQPGTEDDYYDDAPPNRRRIGIMAIAGVFALAVIGTAGAFGYRAIFGSSSVSSPPPVIKAEQAPSKIVPAAATKDAQASKMITERVNDRAQGEKLVSREEQPVPVVTTNSAPSQPQSNGAPQPGSGVVGAEPKKIRTIAIKPDQAGEGAPQQVESAAPAPTSQPRVVSTTPQRPAAPAQAPAPSPVQLAAPQPQAAPQPAPQAEPEPPRAPARAAQAAQPAARAQAPANAPLSLNPNAPMPVRPAAPAAPQRTAAAAAPAAVSAGGGYAVQVSAQRSEEEAQAAFRSLQGKFPSQLGNRQPFIKRVDLGEKGIFFRALVGPFGDSAQANQMCASLKAAGGSCLVQKN